VLEATTDEVRQLIARLQEVPPGPGSLAEHLGDAVGRVGAELGLAVRLEVAPGADLDVSAASGAEIGRITVEALRNAARHGHASSARIALERRDGMACLRISDDGAGFDPALAPGDGRQHFGLKVMQARARRIGGTLTVSSCPGAGTCVELRWGDGAAAAADLVEEVGFGR
jgi:signal transduction histidine kinase